MGQTEAEKAYYEGRKKLSAYLTEMTGRLAHADLNNWDAGVLLQLGVLDRLYQATDSLNALREEVETIKAATRGTRYLEPITEPSRYTCAKCGRAGLKLNSANWCLECFSGGA